MVIDGPNSHIGFFDRIRDFVTSSLLTSSEHMVSNLRTILLLIGGVILLLTLWRILKKLIDFIKSLWVESEPN